MPEPMPADVERLIVALDLKPHPEGGFYRETWRSSSRSGDRDLSTAIYFLLPPGTFSAFHLVHGSDEMWHHYAGDAVEIHLIAPDGGYRVEVLGPAIERGERPQVLVPAGTLQAARARGPRFALCGCTVTPGFEFSAFDIPSRDELLARHPGHEAVIRRLTRSL